MKPFKKIHKIKNYVNFFKSSFFFRLRLLGVLFLFERIKNVQTSE